MFAWASQPNVIYKMYIPKWLLSKVNFPKFAYCSGICIVFLWILQCYGECLTLGSAKHSLLCYRKVKQTRRSWGIARTWLTLFNLLSMHLLYTKSELLLWRCHYIHPEALWEKIGLRFFKCLRFLVF